MSSYICLVTTRLRQTWPRLARTALLALIACGCDDSPTAPLRPPPASPNGSIVVVAAVTGTDLDPDGFDIRVNDGPPRRVANGAAVVFPDIPPGLYSVSIEDISLNCVLREDTPRAVSVVLREPTAIVFNIHCQDRSTSGALRVSVVTPGFSTFSIALGAARVVSTSTGKVLFTDLQPGEYLLRLDVDAGDCAIEGLNPRAATVTAGRITDIAFALTCPNPGRSLAIAVTTTGSNQPSRYTVRVQEQADNYCYYYTCQFKSVQANGSVRFDGLATVGYFVRLEQVPVNCTPQPAIHNNVIVLADRAVQVSFAVHCT